MNHTHLDVCEYTVLQDTQEDLWLFCETHGAWVANLGMSPRVADIIRIYQERIA
jgi:hypothetical protein